jgi:hypothetical protein
VQPFHVRRELFEPPFALTVHHHLPPVPNPPVPNRP